MRKTAKKALGWLLVVVLLLGLLPATAIPVSAAARLSWDELSVGMILEPDTRVNDARGKTVTLAANRYADQFMGDIQSTDFTAVNTTSSLSIEREDGSIYVNSESWLPVSQTGVLCTDWIVLEKSDDAVTLGGYVAPQNDTPFESAVIYQRYSFDDGTPMENGTLAAGEGILIDSLESRWADGGFYIASGEVTIPKRVTVDGAVNLILLDGAALTAACGITVNSGSTLNIFVGSTGSEIAGSGALNANARGQNSELAGIGGDSYTTGGSVNIYGGEITALGKTCGAGIGGGNNGSGGEVRIYAGSVTATGGDNGSWGAAGIGGGFGSAGGTLYVYGGTVTANGTGSSAGIGGGGSTGKAGNGGTVYIYGGTVTANGAGNSAGIGGGASTVQGVGGSGGSVSIYGGTVTATGSGGGVGIGGAPGSGSHGTLTLGSDVALMTSTDNSVWTDTTADPSIRTLYMKTFERPTVDVYLIDQTSAEQSDVRIWAWGSAGNLASDWNDRPAMTYQGSDAVVNREGVNGDPYTAPYYKYTLDVSAYGDGLLFTGPNGQTGNCELTEAQKEAGFAVFYLYYSDNGLGASAGDDVWKFVSHSDASCTQPAIDVYEGMLTSAEDSIQRGSALGHSWGEWVVTTEPGCLTDGEQTRECSVCHETETETLDALGHDFSVLVEEHPADCTTGGYKLYKCSRCDETETRDETEALGHDYRSFTFAPTCTWGGSTTYTCLRCGDSYVEYTDPLGHDFSVLVEEHSADCTTGGYKVYKCSRCNETEIRDETEALGHNYETLVTEPGCTTGGYTTYTCSRCGDSYQDDFTEALGHDWGEWEVDHAPTCTDEGVNFRTCGRCGLVEQETLEPLGHNPGEPVIENYVEPSGSTEGGYDTVVYCQRCNAELSREHTDLEPTGTPEPQLDESLTFSTTISIGVEIKTNFMVVQQMVNNYDSWYLEVSKLDDQGQPTETKRFGEGQEGAVANVNNVVWQAIYTDISAKEMTVPFAVTLHVFDADGQEYYSSTVTNTIKDYVVGELLKTDNTAATRTLCADMLNYGAAAQLYFAYDTDNLVNENLSAAAAAAKDQFETKTEAPAALVNGSNGPNLYGSVSIKNRVVLSITARGVSTEGTVQIQVKKQGASEVKEVLETTKVGSVYSAKFSNVEANEMRDMFEFTILVDGVETGTPLLWSVEGYVRAARESASTGAEELALFNALLIYADSAAAFMAQ